MKFIVQFGLIAMLLFVAFITHYSQDVPAKLLDGAEFSVPDEDRNAGIHGDVKVAIDVNKLGEVEKAIVYIGPGWPCNKDYDSRISGLMRSIEKSVKIYKFSAALKDGKPTDVKLSLTLKIPQAADSGAPVIDLNRKIVSAGVLNGKALSLPKPAYPSAARAEGAGGAVSVKVLVDEKGTVVWAQAISGHPLLMFSARKAACSSKFEKTLMQGEPIKITGVITYGFVP